MSSDSSDTSDNEEQIDDVTEEERLKIRSELSTMSFEQLQKLKEEIGSKMYNKTLHGSIKKKEPKKQFTRENKNRPRERSSKIKPRSNQRNIGLNISLPKKQLQQRKDPRFDEKCGTFDKDQFRTNYKFVEEIKRDERKQLAVEYENTKDGERKKQIKLLMQRIDNQLRESAKLDKLEQKQREDAESFQQKREQGEKPIYKKKSEKKIEDLVAKYEELKKSNKVQKHIERRSRKLQGKERKRLDNFN